VAFGGLGSSYRICSVLAMPLLVVAELVIEMLRVKTFDDRLPAMHGCVHSVV